MAFAPPQTAVIVNMFGALTSGKLVRTDFCQIDLTHFLINIEEMEKSGHIAIFLTGNERMPENSGGLVYLSWYHTESGCSLDWQLLGAICNSKPSAFFKISGVPKNSAFGNLNLGNNFATINKGFSAKIGISVESIDVVEHMVAELAKSKLNAEAVDSCAKRILQNFYEFASSFVTNTRDLPPNAATQVIPLDTLHKWYENFQRKLNINPNFWKTS